VEQLLLSDKSEKEKAACRVKAFKREVRVACVAGSLFQSGSSGGITAALSLLWLFTGIGFRYGGSFTLGSTRFSLMAMEWLIWLYRRKVDESILHCLSRQDTVATGAVTLSGQVVQIGMAAEKVSTRIGH
jgi:hypothetical protein